MGTNFSKDNAGVTTSQIKFCDLHCEHANFPKEKTVDGAGACRTFIALWCRQLEKYVTKNAPCEVLFGSKRPKSNF